MQYSQTVFLRMTPAESAAIEAGSKILETQFSQLVTYAATGAALKLGYHEGASPSVRARPGAWKDAPRRNDDSGTKRKAVTLNPLALKSIEAAADAQDVSVPMFLIGTTLRFLSNKKKSAQAEADAEIHPLKRQAALKTAKALAKLELPEQYT